MSLNNSEKPLRESGFFRQDAVFAPFNQWHISSAYQGIYSIPHGRVVGFEGLMRAFDDQGNIILPGRIFSAIDDQNELLRLDSLCQRLHIQNARLADIGDAWLFINIHSSVVAHIEDFIVYFKSLLDEAGWPSHQVVVEILEDAVPETRQLSYAAAVFRELGCLVAIDDFGAGHSNFDRIWRIKPNLVKLDRSLIVEAENNREAKNIIPGLVSLLHETGSLVVMEGIETESQALIAAESNVDFVQGFYFSRPALTAEVSNESPVELSLTRQTLRKKNLSAAGDYRRKMSALIEAFELAAKSLSACGDLASACMRFLNKEHVECCFLLDEEGYQVDSTLNGKHAFMADDERYRPVKDGKGAYWYSRPYFRRSIFHKHRVNVSRPYLAVNSGIKTVTLSYGYHHQGKTYVLCADIHWLDTDSDYL